MRKAQKKNNHKIVCIKRIRIKNRLLCFFVLLMIVLFLYIKFLAIPVVVANTQTQIKSYATKSINYAVADTMNQNVSYGDLIKVSKDENNNVSFIEANSVRINLLSKTMSRVVMSNFLEFAKIPIKISLGAFSGINILSGVGPKIAFKVNPFGEVNCYFKSNFESAGINQTYHKLYLIIDIKIYIVFPMKRLTINSDAEVLLSESLIVGKIPEVYLNSDSLTQMLNLVPSRFTS